MSMDYVLCRNNNGLENRYIYVWLSRTCGTRFYVVI